jgi:hypothetical protein
MNTHKFSFLKDSWHIFLMDRTLVNKHAVWVIDYHHIIYDRKLKIKNII